MNGTGLNHLLLSRSSFGARRKISAGFMMPTRGIISPAAGAETTDRHMQHRKSLSNIYLLSCSVLVNSHAKGRRFAYRNAWLGERMGDIMASGGSQTQMGMAGVALNSGERCVWCRLVVWYSTVSWSVCCTT